MPLNKKLGAALDQIFRDTPVLSPFAKIKSRMGQDLRLFHHETGTAQQQISFYRDKWWSKEHGGQLYVDLLCLVPAVQMALTGKSQSLATPDFDTPFTHFQYRVLEADAHGGWTIRNADDIEAFSAGVSHWLADTALPWLTRFEHIDNVIDCMQQHMPVNLALFHAARGDMPEAAVAMLGWLDGLPRQIERQLQKMAQAHLLTASDQAELLQASLQDATAYRERLNQWRARAGADATQAR